MATYPNSLFHLTSKEGLYGILENNFKLSYARERIICKEEIQRYAIPMVSFFDMRISELHVPIERRYGNFGIGMKKSWAEKNDLSPVMYTNGECAICDHINLILKILGGANDFSINSVHQDYRDLVTAAVNICRYIKNYKGELWRQNVKIEDDYIFANE